MALIFNVNKHITSEFELIDMLGIDAFIELYIKEEVDTRLKNFTTQVKVCKSKFDDFDLEEGYVKEDEELNRIYDSYINLVNTLFRYAINNCNCSLQECKDMNFCELLDYIKDDVEFREEHKDDID